MRKIACIAVLIFLHFTSRAQLGFEATGDYGKLWDITYDKTVPNKLYARTLANHVMVSTDNGQSWKILYALPNSLTSLSDLRLLPGGQALSFSAYGNPDLNGNGLYVIDLAGALKVHYPAPNASLNPSLAAYSIYDSAAQVILINTSFSIDFAPYTQAYYTKDGGKHWKSVYFSNDYNTVQLDNVAISPNDPNKLYLLRGLGANGENGGLFISTDAGAHWTQQINDKALHPIEFNPRNPDEFFVGSGITFSQEPEALYHTTNGGASFETVPIKWNDFILNCVNVIRYDPVDTNKIWMLEENEVLKSTDKGKTWTSTAYGENSVVYSYGTAIAINPKNNQQQFIVSDGWPQYSADGGATLTQMKAPFYVVSQVALTSDAGPQTLYYGSQGGYIVKDLTTQSAKAYSIHPPFEVSINNENLTLIPDTSHPGHVFIFQPGDGFFNTSVLNYSEDYGATLKQLPADDFSTGLQLIEKDPNNPNKYWVSYTFYNSYSTLYTLDLTDLNNPVMTPVNLVGDGVLAALTVMPGNSGNTVYMAEGTKVYKTEDGGQNWTEMTNGLENIVDGADVIWDMKSNPFDRQEMMLASTQGMFQTKNGGETWTLALPDNDLRRLAYSPVVNGHIIANSYSNVLNDCRLVFTTNDGAQWNEVPAAVMGYLQCSFSTDYKFYNDHADIYLATGDLGVVKYQLKDLLNPLRLHLTDFTGYVSGKNAELLWETIDEQGLQQYELQRSVDDVTFAPINTQAAHGASGTFGYHYEDLEFSSLTAKNGYIYYRLKLLGNDGTFAYSDTVRLNIRDMFIYPVPATSILNLHVQGVTEAGKYTVRVIDAIGRTYSVQQYDIPTGETNITLPVSYLASGMYILLVQTSGHDMRHFKFLKE